MIHPSAIVDEGAAIGEGTKIWHFCHVMGTSTIGKNCVIGQNVFIDRDVKIGDGCKIQNNVSVYRGVTLEDEVFVGPSVVFTNDRTPRAAYPKSSSQYFPTLVKRGASIGANATIVCGAVLGEGSFVGAGALVTGHVLSYKMVIGVPAKIYANVCACGSTIVKPWTSEQLPPHCEHCS